MAVSEEGDFLPLLGTVGGGREEGCCSAGPLTGRPGFLDRGLLFTFFHRLLGSSPPSGVWDTCDWSLWERRLLFGTLQGSHLHKRLQVGLKAPAGAGRRAGWL